MDERDVLKKITQHFFKSWKILGYVMLICILTAVVIWYVGTFFEETIFANIISYFGFSLTFWGVILTILLYRFIGFSEVEKAIKEAKFLGKNNKVDDLNEKLKFIGETLGEDQTHKNDEEKKQLLNELKKNIGSVKMYYERISDNEKAPLYLYKNHFKKLIKSLDNINLDEGINIFSKDMDWELIGNIERLMDDILILKEDE